jgi:hypothetical protein
MHAVGSLPCSLEPASSNCPVPDKSAAHPVSHWMNYYIFSCLTGHQLQNDTFKEVLQNIEVNPVSVTVQFLKRTKNERFQELPFLKYYI